MQRKPKKKKKRTENHMALCGGCSRVRYSIYKTAATRKMQRTTQICKGWRQKLNKRGRLESLAEI
jgi:hypothetical protein